MSASFSSHVVGRLSAALRAVLIAVLAGIPVCGSAQIYECIDAGGKTEFAQKCAPGTVRQREVAKTGANNPDAASPPQTSYQEQEHAFRRRQLERAAEDKKERTAAEAAQKNCAAARARLVSIENARRVRGKSDPQTGQPTYLDDNERAAATQKARDAVSAYCR